jgi:RND family efflux transporter MFP subunit
VRRTITTLLLLAAAAAAAWGVHNRLAELEADAVVSTGARAPVPVEVGPVVRGSIHLRRTFSGALEASAEFVLAPKVGGRLQRLEVDLGDPVERGQLVAQLDDEEFVQAVNQAQAELAVALAGQAEAKSALEIAESGLRRAETLREQGVNSESALDAARAEDLASRSHVEVSNAQVTRATASLEAARIRLDYTRVRATWSGGDDWRVVAQRHVDEGGTASPNSPLMSIVELDPITAVVYVPERDYALLRPGQVATLTTDAYPGRTFEGRVERIAPVFRRATRQARVELVAENADEHLKPGMFVRATIEVSEAADVTIVPFDALTERDDRVGVFALDAATKRVVWRPVEVGVREADRVEVRGDELTGFVVTLGQELCDDGAPVTVTRGLDSSSRESAADDANEVADERPEGAANAPDPSRTQGEARASVEGGAGAASR